MKIPVRTTDGDFFLKIQKHSHLTVIKKLYFALREDGISTLKEYEDQIYWSNRERNRKQASSNNRRGQANFAGLRYVPGNG